MESKLKEEKNLRTFVEFLYILIITPDEIEKYVEMIQWSSSENCISTLISSLVLEYEKRNRKIFHLSAKLIANDSDIDDHLISCVKALWEK